MAYKIKGDVEIAHNLTTGGLSKSTGFDTITQTVLAVTASPVIIDMALGNRDFTVRGDSTSMGSIAVATPTNTSGGNRIRINLSNLDSVDRTFVFDAGYFRTSGNNVDPIVVLAGEGRVVEFLFTNASPVTWVVIYDTGDIPTTVVSYDQANDVLAIGNYRQETGIVAVPASIIAVSFNTTFAVPPKIIHATSTPGGVGIISVSRTSYVGAVTTTGFDLAVVSGAGVFQPADVTWQAVGYV